MNGEQPVKPELTLSEFVALYLERRCRCAATDHHAPPGALGHAERRFGAIPLREFERMADEVAAWQHTPPQAPAMAYRSSSQVLGAAVRWGYILKNPAVAGGQESANLLPGRFGFSATRSWTPSLLS